MKILFVGSVIPKKFENKENFAVSVAGNRMQLGIVEGISANHQDVEAISVFPNPSLRNVIFCKKRVEETERKNLITMVPYINVPIIKQISIMISLIGQLLVKTRDKNENYVILCYNTMSWFAIPVLLVGKIKKIKTVGVVADVPLKSRGILRKIEDDLEIKYISQFGALIPITKHIATDIFRKNEFLVIEGGRELLNENIESIELEPLGKKHIVFLGSINAVSGLDFAIEVINGLQNENICFHIYGNGDKLEEIRKKIENNNRIRYEGVVDNNMALRIERSADLLICPRQPDGYVTKYTFPSKLLEYMLSGTPVICNKLEGIPDEYGQYISLLDDKTDVWIREIEIILFENEDKYKKRANEAKFFIKNNKTWELQAKEIMGLLKDI